MSYKVELKKNGKWNAARDDFGSKPLYFQNKREANEYANSLTKFQTKVVSTKKRNTTQGGWGWL